MQLNPIAKICIIQFRIAKLQLFYKIDKFFFFYFGFWLLAVGCFFERQQVNETTSCFIV